ncbi:MAG: DUF6527 family protein [Terricaulis sp.]
MKHDRLSHEFVNHLPGVLEPGVLYISIDYATAAHRCCCGCGEEVVTPFTPTDWRMIFDGETISLRPSIGNWNFACRSHYVIDRGRVIESAPWTDDQVAAERRRDRAAKAHYYNAPAPEVSHPPAAESAPRIAGDAPSLLSRLLARLGW